MTRFLQMDKQMQRNRSAGIVTQRNLQYLLNSTSTSVSLQTHAKTST